MGMTAQELIDWLKRMIDERRIDKTTTITFDPAACSAGGADNVHYAFVGELPTLGDPAIRFPPTRRVVVLR